MNTHFSEFRRNVGSFNRLASELRLIESLPAKMPSTNHLEELPQHCIFIENWLELGHFDGPAIISLSASHQLTSGSERELALQWIHSAIGSRNRIAIAESLDLGFQREDLRKPGTVEVAAGWTADNEVDFRGYFIDIRISCSPMNASAEYYISFWNKIAEIWGLMQEVAVEKVDSGWYVRSKGKLKTKSTVGGLNGENPKGLAIYGFNDVQHLENLVGRLSEIGTMRELRSSCKLQNNYEQVRSTAVGFSAGWKVSVSCELSPTDRQALARHTEPSVNRLPGANFSWPDSVDEVKTHFSCGFHRIDGSWWSVLGAFSKSASTDDEFAQIVANQGYERSA